MDNRSPDLQVLRAAQMLGPLLGIFKSDDGKHWTRVNAEPVQEDLETTVAKLRIEHSIHSPNAWMKVVDIKNGTVLHDQPPVAPHRSIEQFFPPVDDEERNRRREEWTERVLEWVMGEAFLRHAAKIKNDARRDRLVSSWLKRHKIAVETHLNGARRVLRGDEPIAEWLV